MTHFGDIDIPVAGGFRIPITPELLADFEVVERMRIISMNGGYMAPRLLEYWMDRGGSRAYFGFRLRCWIESREKGISQDIPSIDKQEGTQ